MLSIDCPTNNFNSFNQNEHLYLSVISHLISAHCSPNYIRVTSDINHNRQHLFKQCILLPKQQTIMFKNEKNQFMQFKSNSISSKNCLYSFFPDN